MTHPNTTQMIRPGGIVPIDIETTAALVAEIKRQHANLERKDALLRQALDALEESENLVRNEYQEDWRHGIPTRKAQLEAMRKLVEAHEQAVIDIKQELAK